MNQKESYSVRAVSVNYIHGIGIISFRLAHLLAVRRKNHTAYDAVKESRSFKQSRGKHGKGVKPAPCLIQAFADKVRRKVAFKKFLVLERIMILRVGHGA